MSIESGDTVVIEYVGRIVEDDGDDDVIFDTSRESVAEESGLTELQPDNDFSPLTVEIDGGELLDGVEEALVGRQRNESFSVTIPPEEAYGTWTEDDVREYDVEELKERIGGYDPVEGANLETESGRHVEIVSVDDKSAHVDLNHPLAGQMLAFDVEIVDVK